jgi:coenzyme F420-reducing hydrogenase alpha subunit
VLLGAVTLVAVEAVEAVIGAAVPDSMAILRRATQELVVVQAI